MPNLNTNKWNQSLKPVFCFLASKMYVWIQQSLSNKTERAILPYHIPLKYIFTLYFLCLLKISCILSISNIKETATRIDALWKKVVLNTKFTWKHLCQGLIFHKVASIRPATLFKKEILAHVLSCKFWEIIKDNFFQNTSGRLLLNIGYFSLINISNSVYFPALL